MEVNRNLKKLMDTDIQFCNDCQLDKEKAWMKYTCQESLMGTRGHEPYISKRDEIENIIQYIFSLDNIKFTWEPQFAFISDDATLGVTTGTYHRFYLLEGVEQEEKGKYVTVWKKINEEWKIIFDMGN